MRRLSEVNIFKLLFEAILPAALLISCNIGTFEEERTFRLTIAVQSTVVTEVNIEFLNTFTDPEGVSWTPVSTTLSSTPVDSQQFYTGIVDRTEERSVRVSAAYTLAAAGDSASVLVTYEELVLDGWSEPQVLFDETDEYNTGGSNEQANILQQNVLIPTP